MKLGSRGKAGRRSWVLKEVLQSKPERWALGQKNDQQWGGGEGKPEDRQMGRVEYREVRKTGTRPG